MSARGRIVAAALGWVGTPYRHQASLRGVGCDCLGLVRGVWREAVGPEPEVPPAYAPDWAEAGGQDLLADALQRHCRPVRPGDAAAGDIVLFRRRSGLPAKHAGILVARCRFVHAYGGQCVTTDDLYPRWVVRLAGVFSFPGAD